MVEWVNLTVHLCENICSNELNPFYCLGFLQTEPYIVLVTNLRILLFQMTIIGMYWNLIGKKEMSLLALTEMIVLFLVLVLLFSFLIILSLILLKKYFSDLIYPVSGLINVLNKNHLSLCFGEYFICSKTDVLIEMLSFLPEAFFSFFEKLITFMIFS